MAAEAQPSAFVTVNVYVVDSGRSEIVVLVPVPDVVTASGYLVRVHVPEPGNPLRITLPVATAQSGCVIVPTIGTEGVTGCVFISILPVEDEVHPSVFVTVNEYVFGLSPVIVVELPVPEYVVPPGVRTIVHVPVEGNPPNTILPVATVQVG